MGGDALRHEDGDFSHEQEYIPCSSAAGAQPLTSEEAFRNAGTRDRPKLRHATRFTCRPGSRIKSSDESRTSIEIAPFAGEKSSSVIVLPGKINGQKKRTSYYDAFRFGCRPDGLRIYRKLKSAWTASSRKSSPGAWLIRKHLIKSQLLVLCTHEKLSYVVDRNLLETDCHTALPYNQSESD